MMTTVVTRDTLQSAAARGSVTIVDARPAYPYGKRHIPGALNLIVEEAEVEAEVLLPVRLAPIVIYSTDAGCWRGAALAEALARLGYSRIQLYRDGLADWVRAGLPVETGIPDPVRAMDHPAVNGPGFPPAVPQQDDRLRAVAGRR
jgi:rhodanese-related sulfurtransferase